MEYMVRNTIELENRKMATEEEKEMKIDQRQLKFIIISISAHATIFRKLSIETNLW